MAKISVDEFTQFFEVSVRIYPECEEERAELRRLYEVLKRAAGGGQSRGSVELRNVNVVLRLSGRGYELIITDV